MVYRGVRGGVTDRWYKTVKDKDGTTTTIPSKAHGVQKRWAARYVDAESREHQKVFEVKREAETWLRKQLAAVDTGAHVDPRAGRITVRAFYEAHVMGTDGHLAKATRTKRRTWWNRYVGPRWGNTPIVGVTPAGLRGWVTNLADSGLAPGTVRGIVYMFSVVLNAAVEQGVIARSPIEGIQLPKGAGRRRGYLTYEQVERLALAAAKRGRESDGSAVRFMAFTGVRFGELSGITVADLKPTARRVRVYSTKTHTYRNVPYPESLAPDLLALRTGRSPDAPLFPTARGKVIRQHWRENVFDLAVEDVRAEDQTFPRVTPHDMRHTCASLAVAAGASVLALSRILGHAKPSITLNVYADLFDPDLDHVADLLDAGIRSAAAPAESLRNTEVGSDDSGN